MIIQNRSARAYGLNGGLLAPGDIAEVTDAQGAAMIKAGTHRVRRQDGSFQPGAVHEIVEVKGAADPMPAVKVPGLSSLPEEKAIDLINRCNLESVGKLIEDETRPAVLAAAKARQVPAAPPPPPPPAWTPPAKE